MRRRRFLQAVTALSFGGLGRAFADPARCPDEAVEALAHAFARARRAHKPLLVLVIPEANDARWARGDALGAFLNHARDEALAPLALAELVCATLAELAQLLPHELDGDPTFVRVETSRVPASAAAFTVEPSALAPRAKDRAERRRLADEQLEQQIEAIGAAVRAALAPDEAALSARARAAAEGLPSEELRALASGPLDALALERIDRGAAIVLARGGAEALVADAARARLVASRIAGSRWARSSGCGVSLEDASPDERLMVACGMGHVPEKAQRFLHFFKRFPRGER